MPPLQGLHANAIANYSDTTASRPSNETNTAHAEYDELDPLPPPGLQVSTVAIYNGPCLPRASDSTRRPALALPTDSDQTNAETTYAGIAGWLTRNR
jgi:hypothetical protein